MAKKSADETEKRTILSKSKFKYIDMVSVELEGGWDVQPSYEVHGDGSVTVPAAKTGESWVEKKKSMAAVFAGMKERYPLVVDSSCGMHIHVSMPDSYYARLTEKRFHNYFMARMTKLGTLLAMSKKTIDYNRFKKRLDGENTYCKNKFLPDKQILRTDKGGERYCQLNYCYGLHKTLECRLFPMFESFSNAKLAVAEYLDTIETYLSKTKDRKVGVEVEFEPIEKGVLMEEFICA